jgi:CheY-like chemotaxis protein
MESHRAQSCHFLLVEDNRDDALLLERAFKTLGASFSFSLCRNLSEAKAYLRGAGIYADRSKFPVPDLILSDLNIGVDSAIELLTERPEEPSIQNIPIIVMSGTAPPRELQATLASGARQVLEKPFDQSGLVLLLSNLASTYCPEISMNRATGIFVRS